MSAAFASPGGCISLGTAQTKTVTFGSIAVDASAAVGSVIASKTTSKFPSTLWSTHPSYNVWGKLLAPFDSPVSEMSNV